MNDLVSALENRISLLQDEKQELEDSLARINAKLDAYIDLLVEEKGEDISVSPPKRKPGRPKGSRSRKSSTSKTKKDKKSKHAVKDDLWEEASNSLPGGVSLTSQEEQKRAINRYNPSPRPAPQYGVKAGDPKEVLGTTEKNSHVNISVEND